MGGHVNNPTYKQVCGRAPPATPRSCASPSIRRWRSDGDLLDVFFVIDDPTQRTDRATTSAPGPLGDLRPTRGPGACCQREDQSARRTKGCTTTVPPRHGGDARGGPSVCRGLSPGVLRQQSGMSPYRHGSRSAEGGEVPKILSGPPEEQRKRYCSSRAGRGQRRSKTTRATPKKRKPVGATSSRSSRRGASCANTTSISPRVRTAAGVCTANARNQSSRRPRQPDLQRRTRARP